MADDLVAGAGVTAAHIGVDGRGEPGPLEILGDQGQGPRHPKMPRKR